MKCSVAEFQRASKYTIISKDQGGGGINIF